MKFSRKMFAYITMAVFGFLGFAIYCFTALRAEPPIIIDWKVIISFFGYNVLATTLLVSTNTIDKWLRIAKGIKEVK